MTRTPSLAHCARAAAALLLAACDVRAPAAADSVRVSAPAAADSVHAPAPARSADSARSDWVVSPDGYGPVRVGVPLADAAAALGTRLVLDSADMLGSCGHVPLPPADGGVLAMVYDDSIARIEVDSPGVRTALGDEVGSSEADVLARHGALARVEPHPYPSADGSHGHYIVVPMAGDTNRRYVFETDGRRVTSYRAGRMPAVALIEGCA